jgi:hypothetical protein
MRPLQITALPIGVAIGLALGIAGQALGREVWASQPDRYLADWKVLAGGREICSGPYVRASEREIDCRSAGF